MKNTTVFFQGVIQLFVAVGAIICGSILIVDPSGVTMKMSVKMLAGTPFADFLAPGIILLLINGFGQLAAGVLTFRRSRVSGLFGACFGIALMIWIFVQVNMIGGRNGLQYSYFGIGALETVLSFFIHGGFLDSTTPVLRGSGEIADPRGQEGGAHPTP